MFDESNAFDGFDGRVDKLLVACGEGKGQCVVDQVFRFESEFVDGDIVDALGDFEFSFAGLCHAILVNGHDDDRGVVCFCQRKNFIGFRATRFEMS